MSTMQLNPMGMLSTTEGYISSISIRTGGGVSVLTPTTILGVAERIAVSNEAMTNLISAQRSPIGGTLTMVQA